MEVTESAETVSQKMASPKGALEVLKLLEAFDLNLSVLLN